MRECVLACVRACVRACVLACLRDCVVACLRHCVLACLRACVRACVRALTYVDKINENSDSAILLHIYLLGKFRTNEIAPVSR